MNEAVDGLGGQQAPADGAGAATAGMLLREAREAAGLHVAALAVALKVPVRKLEALEADRFEQLPDAVFVRALAASVCRTLKIDPAPVLRRLPQTGAPRLSAHEGGINTPFRPPSDNPRPGVLDQLSRPVFLLVLALLVGALVVILLPSTHREEVALIKPEAAPPVQMDYQAPPESQVQGSAAGGAAAPAADASAASGMAAPTAGGSAVGGSAPLSALSENFGSGAAVPMPARAAATGAALPVAATPAAGAPAPTLTLARPGAVLTAPAAATVTQSTSPTVMPTSTASAARTVTIAGPAPATASDPAGGIVVFRARKDSWVQVTDARGLVALRRVLVSGETASASGVPPLKVTVGSASATDVEVRGRPLDLAPLSRDNVARFEVK